MKPSTVKAKFRRYQLQAINTNILEETNVFVRDAVLDQIKFEEGETGILLYHPSTSYWWLLSDKKLFLFSDGSLSEISLKRIKEVDAWSEIKKIRSKSELAAINLITNDGGIILKVEKGTWHAVSGAIELLID